MFEQWASFLSNIVHTSPLLTSTQAADKDIISEVGLVVSLFMYKPGITTLPNGENKLPSLVKHHPFPDAPSCPVEMFETTGHRQGKSDTRPSEQIHIFEESHFAKFFCH